MSGKRGTSSRSLRAAARAAHAVRPDADEIYTFSAEYDEEGVFFYQAYCAEIADWAVEHQTLGGPSFNPTRMTWVKPSFAWMLYRCGYGLKHGQQRTLKIKLPHGAVAALLADCACTDGGGGAKGRIQWDPARDLFSSEGKGNGTEPRRMLRERAIQIGLSRDLSQRFTEAILAVVDVSALAARVGAAHRAKDVGAAMASLRAELPAERPYMPRCAPRELVRLRLMRADEAGAAAGEAAAGAAGAAGAGAAAAASFGPSHGPRSAAAEAAEGGGAEAAGGDEEAEGEAAAGHAVDDAPMTKRQRSWGERSLAAALALSQIT